MAAGIKEPYFQSNSFQSSNDQVVLNIVTKMEVSQECVIPGTFYAWDRMPVLFEFVRESLVDGWQPFELIAPGNQKLQESDDIALAECNLVSRQWVNLSNIKWEDHILSYIEA